MPTPADAEPGVGQQGLEVAEVEGGAEGAQKAPVGGTDGAQLCYMGLPCPNLCTGGYAFHGPFEHIASEDMELCARMLDTSIAVSRVLTVARRSAGVRFPGDRF